MSRLRAKDEQKVVTRKASKLTLKIVHLYPKEMNIYGDTGNLLVLRRRAVWREIAVQVQYVGVGDPVPDDVDIVMSGGGQDAGQGAIQDDLQQKAAALHRLAQKGAVMLMICGMYQLFGRSFTTKEGVVIHGIGVLPLETVGGDVRMIGNTSYITPFGEIVGYENHSGITKLDSEGDKFGIAVLGDGNNQFDKTEGSRVHNVFGTYSHGPVLAKNPQFADELLRLALERKYGKGVTLQPLDDTIENLAHETAKFRPR